MKILIFTFFISIFGLTAQKIGVYGDLPSGKQKYDMYITKMGDTIRTGQKVLIGLPSSDNGFNHITQGGQKAAVFLSDRVVTISQMRTYSDRRFEKRMYLQFKGYGLLPVDIDIELALKTGEVEMIKAL